MTTANAQVPTVVDQRTGQAVPVYLGGEAPTEPSATSASVDRGDKLAAVAAAIPASDDAAAEPVAATNPAAEPQSNANAADPAATDPAAAQLSDSVTSDDDPRRNERGIPKKRFDEVNQRRKVAEQKLAQLERESKATQQAHEATYDFDAKEKEYLDLVLDGKTQEAIALRKEIRAAERAEFQRVATEQAQTVTKQATVQERIQEISARYESDYNVFDPESENYSEDVLDDLHSLYTGYGQSGKFADAATAFEAAIQKTLKMHGIEKKGAVASAATAAQPAKQPASTTRTAQKRVEAIANQPPLIARTGVQSADHGHSNIDVKSLSPDEIMKLPEATRRRLRGDNL
jgi:hypothetical protein